MNYKKLIDQVPTQLGEEFLNSAGQKITFYEHPTGGDSVQVVCVCHDLKLAALSDFFEIDDMIADHREYEPIFTKEGNLVSGFEWEGLEDEGPGEVEDSKYDGQMADLVLFNYNEDPCGVVVFQS